MSLKLFCLAIVILSNVVPSITRVAKKNKCTIERRVKMAIKTMNRSFVTEVADCLLGVGECDAIGSEVKGQIKEAVCSKPCNRKTNCSCEQIQVRLILRKIRAEFNDQYLRVFGEYEKQC
eukprot:GFUD01041394.1.p1 GENE.GFUD01041394.1~~GFUD01041394.1.p1  ORF type:complete len:120 (-),score=24.99 GFUD01041394.1:112-471(-)